jgi:hypothetical protein
MTNALKSQIFIFGRAASRRGNVDGGVLSSKGRQQVVR